MVIQKRNHTILTPIPLSDAHTCFSFVLSVCLSVYKSCNCKTKSDYSSILHRKLTYLATNTQSSTSVLHNEWG